MRATFLAAALLCLTAFGASAGQFEPSFGGLHGAMGSVPLLERALRDVGRNPTGLSHQWCGRQMAMWLGHGGNTAISYAHVGSPSEPRPGAIAVMAHHVGVVQSVGPGYVVLVSGNHAGHSGHRTVGIGRYSMARIVAFRWPS